MGIVLKMLPVLGYFLFSTTVYALIHSALVKKSTMQVVYSTPAPKFGGIQHAGILVEDTEKSKRFYMEVFGFTDESHLRPSTLPFAGAFLSCGASQIHLMQLPTNDPKTGRPEHGGRDRHVALNINNIDMIRERLEARQIAFTMSKSGRRALFCRDLDGNAYEFIEDPQL